MKILYISDYFLDDGTVAVERPRKQVAFLSTQGHNVTVLCSESNRADTSYQINAGVKVITISRIHLAEIWFSHYGHMKSLILRRKTKPIDTKQLQGMQYPTAIYGKDPNSKSDISASNYKRIFSFIMNRAEMILNESSDRKWARLGAREIRKTKDRYDVVISSCSPYNAVLCGKQLKAQGIAKHWICDLRDLIRDGITEEVYLRKAIRKETMISRHCEGIVCVSNGQRLSFIENNRNKLSHGTDQVHAIYTGMAPRIHRDLRGKTGLMIVLTGAYVVSGIKMLFDAISQCEKEGYTGISFIHVGGGCEFINELAKSLHLANCSSRGRVSKIEAQELQQRSDVAVLFNNESPIQIGGIHGKFTEYLAARRPIISITFTFKDEVELTSIIRKHRLGFAQNCVNGECDAQRLYEYLLKSIHEKEMMGQVHFQPDEEVYRIFSNEYVGRQLEELCEKICKGR